MFALEFVRSAGTWVTAEDSSIVNVLASTHEFMKGAICYHSSALTESDVSVCCVTETRTCRVPCLFAV